MSRCRASHCVGDEAEFRPEGRPQGMGVGKAGPEGDILQAPGSARQEILPRASRARLSQSPRLPPSGRGYDG